MIKYSKLREKLGVETLNGNVEDLAYFTHYLHNYKNKDSKPYEKRAKKYFYDLNEELSIVSEPELQAMLPIKWDIPFPAPENPEFTFIDLFAGIGGMRLAFESCGGECVFSCEWDRYCQRTYYENFGELPYGDITKIREDDIPDHDVLIAGFPCQPFSIAGVSKKHREHCFLM
jgi:DNA (cytosine-5)-methyltransferase 1